MRFLSTMASIDALWSTSPDLLIVIRTSHGIRDSEAPDVSFSVRYQGLLRAISLSVGLIGSLHVALHRMVHCEGR